jgi:predicted HD phosphohydrolase
MTGHGQITFTEMKHGTREEYEILESYGAEQSARLVPSLLGLLEQMKGPLDGYRIDRYQHSLQTATRAFRDGAEEEMVAAALLHDIGDVLAPKNHSQVAAAILRPYVSERIHWVVLHHGIFQGYYYWHHLGGDRNSRDRYRGHPFFEDCAAFCENWDQNSFDPAYDTMPIEAFTPLIHRVFSAPRETFG